MNDVNVFAAVEQAQRTLALYKNRTDGIPKEAHRALALVATKLDEARLWFEEASQLIADANSERSD